MQRKSQPVVKVGLAVVLMLAVSSVCGAALSPEMEQWVLEQKWEQARQALTADDSATADPAARLLLGYACLMAGDYRGATEQFARLGNAADAAKLVDYTSALARCHPGNAIAQMLKGDALARSRRYDEALVALDKAVHLNPDSALGYDVRGVVYALADKPDEACADFEKAMEIAPRFADALVNLGILKLGEEDLVAALDYLSRGIEAATDPGVRYQISQRADHIVKAV